MTDGSGLDGDKKDRLGSGGQTGKLFLFLPVFGLLGAFTFMQFVLAVRGLFDGGALYLLVRLAWFALSVALLVYVFRKFRTVRKSFGDSVETQLALVSLGWVFAFGGAVAWRLTWKSPADKMVQRIEMQAEACRKHIASVLQVSVVSDSHVPGDGYITLKASFLAKTRLTVWGGGWLASDMPGLHFHSEMQRAQLEADLPRELEIHLVANPSYSNIPLLTADGPYSFRKIPVYVLDPVKGLESGAVGEDCRVDIISSFVTSRAYKAGDFGREAWSGGIDSSFRPASNSAPK